MAYGFMHISEFDFTLPDDLIAQAPLTPRAQANLLEVLPNGCLQDRHVSDLLEILQAGDLLIVNDCKVLPSRLDGYIFDAITGENGPKIEATLIESLAQSEHDLALWRALAKPGRKAKLGKSIRFGEIGDGIEAVVQDKPEDGSLILSFSLTNQALNAKLWHLGRMPLPPYIRRSAATLANHQQDGRDYQTIFATREGAVAAPTAGLHIDEAMRSALIAKGIEIASVTLMVGAGTFQPVRVEAIEDHIMHREWGEVSEAIAKRISDQKAKGGRVIALGTTSLRIVEQAARNSPSPHQLQPYRGDTSLFLTPGSPILLFDGLITNFHLPKSTLFMLVAAFAGLPQMRAAYAHAIQHRYRFYSYGDCCFLHRPADR